MKPYDHSPDAVTALLDDALAEYDASHPDYRCDCGEASDPGTDSICRSCAGACYPITPRILDGPRILAALRSDPAAARAVIDALLDTNKED